MLSEGRALSSEFWPEPRVPPPRVRTGIVVGAGGGEGLAEGCWKTANEQR